MYMVYQTGYAIGSTMKNDSVEFEKKEISPQLFLSLSSPECLRPPPSSTALNPFS